MSKLKTYTGVQCKGETNKIGVSYTHSHEVVELEKQDTFFKVRGTYFHPGTNSELPVEKEFDSFDNAKGYLLSFIKDHSISFLCIEEVSIKRLLEYR